MSSLIGEPFQVSSYPVPTKIRHEKVHNPTYASYGRDFPGHATVTVQAEGIHIVDLSELHTVASHTCGSNVAFSGPASSRCTLEDDERICTTYALVSSAPEVAVKNRDRTVWIVKQKILGGTSGKSDKREIVLPHEVARIYSDNKSSNILLVSSTGDISVADDELNIQSTLVCPHQQNFLDVFFFPGTSCNFFPPHENPPDTIIVFCSSSDSMLLLSIVFVTGKDMTIIGQNQVSISHGVPGRKTDHHVIALSCGPCGVLSYINESHTWAAYQLEVNNLTTSMTQIGETLALAQLSHSNAHSFGRGMCLLSLGSSLVLLAAMTATPSSEISILLWDMRYGVVIASHAIPIPSTIAPSIKQGIDMNLLLADAGQVLLTLCPANISRTASSTSESPYRSIVYIIPLDPNLKSTIAGAIGKTHATSEWLVPNPKAETLADNDPRSKLLVDMSNHLQRNEPHKADEAFFRWAKAHTSAGGSPSSNALSISTPDGAALEALYGYGFVKELLALFFAKEYTDKPQYSPRVMRHLIESRVVSAGMVDGRLLTALKQYGDWESIMLSFNSVVDISEDEMISLAKALIDEQREPQPDPEVMNVDSNKAWTPTLSAYMLMCVSYPTSPAALRLAIRKHLPDAQDLILILELLDGWTVGGTEEYIRTLLKSVASNTLIEHRGGAAPPYDKTISFLQVLLDASFVSLLQFPPSHDLLRSIMSHIEPEIGLHERVGNLRGALEPFAKAQNRIVKERAEGTPKETPNEWRKRRKHQEQQIALGVGLYRLEELVI
ncbi:uncharacterized protein F5891DRAFT_1274949 [Suillus fuscotomentosus]|uniref:Uncharacterized protein n=1 Tax=Suillus fuscotomentosus TaxID=1912939 RepID=A0AAD4EGN9_9AGAM|nr:uncharacterized protein F5891DRAFT_1274949 [Suillus fuscotomentosus]KAG1905904.1 hypothetical protein F5891DRAFT_1274949 [Suillus fuscotomentosus]